VRVRQRLAVYLHLIGAEQFGSQGRLVACVVSRQNGLAGTLPRKEQAPDYPIVGQSHFEYPFVCIEPRQCRIG
jgi:hypothetical protein